MRSLVYGDVFFFNCGQRSDCVWKLTVDQFAHGQWKDDVYVVTIMDHKTSHTHGGASLPITAPVKALVDIFMRYAQRASRQVRWTGHPGCLKLTAAVRDTL